MTRYVRVGVDVSQEMEAMSEEILPVGCTLFPGHAGTVFVLDNPVALVGFQGRGCADGVQPDFCPSLLLEVLIFQEPSN